MQQRVIHGLDFSEQSRNIQMAICLQSCIIDHQAVLPVYIVAKQSLHPIENLILQVLWECEIILSNSITIFVFMEYPLRDH